MVFQMAGMPTASSKACPTLSSPKSVGFCTRREAESFGSDSTAGAVPCRAQSWCAGPAWRDNARLGTVRPLGLRPTCLTFSWSPPSTGDRWLGSRMSSGRPASRCLNCLRSPHARPFTTQTIHVRHQDARAELREAPSFFIHSKLEDRAARGNSAGRDFVAAM